MAIKAAASAPAPEAGSGRPGPRSRRVPALRPAARRPSSWERVRLALAFAAASAAEPVAAVAPVLASAWPLPASGSTGASVSCASAAWAFAVLSVAAPTPAPASAAGVAVATWVVAVGRTGGRTGAATSVSRLPSGVAVVVVASPVAVLSSPSVLPLVLESPGVAAVVPVVALPAPLAPEGLGPWRLHAKHARHHRFEVGGRIARLSTRRRAYRRAGRHAGTGR